MKNSNLSAFNIKKLAISMCRHLSPPYSHAILVSGCQLTKTWMCNIRLQAPTVDVRCDILHRIPFGADGQTDVRSRDYTCFAGLRSRARRAPLLLFKCISINLCLDPLLSSQVTCSNCNHESVKYQPFTFLSVPVSSESYHTFGKYSYFDLDLFNRQCFK